MRRLIVLTPAFVMKRYRRQSFERRHLASIEVCGEHHPADQARRHNRRGDKLAWRTAQDRDSAHSAGIEWLPERLGFSGEARVSQAMNASVQRDNECTLHPKPGRGIVQRRLHRGRIAGRDGRAEPEVPCKQLSCALKLAGTLLPEPVIDGTARLKLALDLPGRGAGNER